MWPDARKLVGLDALDDASTDEYWGEIVGFDWQVGAWASVQLCIHHLHRPPYVASIRCRVPRGVTPAVGQRYAIRHVNHGGSAPKVDNHWAIRWDRPPQYGVEDPPRREIDAAIKETLLATAAPPIAALDEKLASGEISQADHDSTVEYLKGFYRR
jgi:hypothetical protein